jgi:hypothetical protein
MSEGVDEQTYRLVPLKYHDDILTYLQQEEPAVWEWSQSVDVRQQQADEVRDAMLRHTYRMEPEGHPDVYAACKRAMDALGIDAPATLYQAADGMMNAALCFIPGEVHLIFYGPILDKLSGDELLALMGHELAHYRLWMAKDGAYYNASRVLDHAMSYADASPSHRETARLFSLHTELYADRGAALVVADTAPAIAMLVKTMTGIAGVDAAAYLRQAEELDARPGQSDAQSHPELFLRARALDQWWRSADGVDDWIETRLCGPMSINALDLLRQRDLTTFTRGFFVRVMAGLGIESDAVKTQIRRYFPDWQENEAALDLTQIDDTRIDDSTRHYFISLLFDCAMADVRRRVETRPEMDQGRRRPAGRPSSKGSLT